MALRHSRSTIAEPPVICAALSQPYAPLSARFFVLNLDSVLFEPANSGAKWENLLGSAAYPSAPDSSSRPLTQRPHLCATATQPSSGLL